jgi:putative nucleotidyltransferase with HDIG domain
VDTVGSRISDVEVSSQVEEAVVRRIAADDLALPPLPVVAAKCLSLLSAPSFSLAEVARLIETDPIVAAQVVRLANAAARAPVAPIRSIAECVARVGGNELRVFLLETSARRTFESVDRDISRICRGLWEHSLAVALMARDLLRQAKVDRADTGYLGGLLHDIGKPVTATMLLEAETRLRGKRTQNWFPPATWSELIARIHRKVGVALAEKWGLPDGIGRIIRDSADYDSADPHSEANAVRLANALAKREGIYVGAVDADEIDSQIFVGRALFAIDDEQMQYLTRYLKERIQERLV